ncbi:MAG: ABC transporter ATP-binding protein [Chloroflexota bacterium]
MENIQQRATFGDYFRLLLKYSAPQKYRVTLLGVLVLTTIGFKLVNPQLIRVFLDSAEQGSPLSRLLGAAALFIAATLVEQACLLGATYVSEDVGWRATNWLRADLARHCLGLDLSFHKTHPPGELIERVDGDVNELAQFFSEMVIRIFGNVLLFIGVVVVIWLEGWQIGLTLTVVAVISTIILEILRRISTRRWEAVRETDADLFGFIEERLNGLEDVRANGAQHYVMDRLYRYLQVRWQKVHRAIWVGMWVIPFPIWVFGIAFSAAHLVGGRLFVENEITIGSLYLIFYYINLAESPLWDIIHQFERLQRAGAGINRITRLLKVESTMPEGQGITLAEGPLAVQFDNVTFHYNDAPSIGAPTIDDAMAHEEESPQEIVLNDLSFTLAPGKVLGVLGRTGSGKSTLTKLIYRFYDPVEGVIRLGQPSDAQLDADSVDMDLVWQGLHEAHPADLRGHIGMVTQEVQLFQASVRNNLTFFDDTIDDDPILAILDDVGLTPWLESLPDGLDTKLGDQSAASLSAGEAQLLAFSRVFLVNPGLVILDEASSRLDPVTEQHIEQALDKLFVNRTGIIVAHRLATVQRADYILILEKGQVQEYGERKTLLADPNSRFSQLLHTGSVAGRATGNITRSITGSVIA